MQNYLQQRYATIVSNKTDSTDKDEALGLIQVMKTVNHQELSAYKFDFQKTNSYISNGNIILEGVFNQYFTWKNTSMETAFSDEVSFVIDPRNGAISTTLPQSAVPASELVTKALTSQQRSLVEYNKNLSIIDTNTASPLSTQSITYNRTAAVNYALKYALSNNSSYWSFSNDCTNFASQVVYAGGIPQYHVLQNETQSPNWWIQAGSGGQWLYAVPWVQANAFFNLIRNTNTIKGTSRSTVLGMSLGDIINYDHGSNGADGTIDHTAVITDIQSVYNPSTGYSTQYYVSYHTTNRKNVPWDFYPNNTSDPTASLFTHIEDNQ